MFTLELREIDGVPHVTGYVVRYGDEADLGHFKERFVPGSVTLAERVHVNVQHDRRASVAAYPTSAKMELREDGVYMESRLVGMYGRDARERIDAGILTGLSSEFSVKQERWTGELRIIQSALITGVGIVDRPAYQKSVIERAAKVEVHRPPPRRIFL